MDAAVVPLKPPSQALVEVHSCAKGTTRCYACGETVGTPHLESCTCWLRGRYWKVVSALFEPGADVEAVVRRAGPLIEALRKYDPEHADSLESVSIKRARAQSARR